MERPNVCLIVIDSLRADVVNGSFVETPNIEEVGRRGTSFLQCIATSDSTTPSFASFLTGCYPPAHGLRGLRGFRLDPSVTTMAGAFREAGYATHAEITGPLIPETGIGRGFEFVNVRPGHLAPFMEWRDGLIERIRGYTKPWLLLLHVWEVHRPYMPPPTFKKKVGRKGYARIVEAVDSALRPLLDQFDPFETITVVTGDHGERYAGSWAEDRYRAVLRDIRRYLRPHRRFPRVDDFLQRRALGHGFGLFEDVIRVPLLVMGPGVTQKEISQQVRHVDLFPTLTDLCGIDAPTLDGRSLAPLMAGQPMPEQPAYMETLDAILPDTERVHGIRTSEWKLVRSRRGTKLFEMDGVQYAEERVDLMKSEPEVAARLGAELDQMLKGTVQREAPLTSEEEAIVEKRLQDLGYL